MPGVRIDNSPHPLPSPPSPSTIKKCNDRRCCRLETTDPKHLHLSVHRIAAAATASHSGGWHPDKHSTLSQNPVGRLAALEVAHSFSSQIKITRPTCRPRYTASPTQPCTAALTKQQSFPNKPHLELHLSPNRCRCHDPRKSSRGNCSPKQQSCSPGGGRRGDTQRQARASIKPTPHAGRAGDEGHAL